MARARASGSVASAAPASTAASARLGVTTVARGRMSCLRAWTALSSRRRAPDSATMTGSTTTGVLAGRRSSAWTTAAMVVRVAEHPDLDRVDADVLGHGFHLRDDDLGRHRLDGVDADGALGGDRGDRGQAVDAAGGEGLEVGLDACPATGVRAGDREDRGRARHGGSRVGPAHFRHASRPMRHTADRTVAACSPASPPSRSTGSTRSRSRWRPTSGRACPRSAWSGSPTARCARRASASARPSATRASSSRPGGSRSTSPPRG